MNFANRSGNVLFWVLAPALVPLLVAPLLVGHVVVRLLIARMRRRPERLQAATPTRAITASTAPPSWGSPMLRGLSSRS